MKYFYLLVIVLLSAPVELFAAGAERIEYSNPLVNIPGYSGSSSSFSDFVNLIYGVSISVAALLAVVKIVIAGLKWMLSDIVTDKTEAKKDIQSALFGLIIIISAVLIITTINPTIVGGTGG